MEIPEVLAACENRLDFLEVQVDALRGLISAHLAILDREFPGTADQAYSIAYATMERRSLARLGPLKGALDALIENIQHFRDLPAND